MDINPPPETLSRGIKQHLEGVQVELDMQGLACAASTVEAAGLCELPVVELAAQAGPGVGALPEEHPAEALPHP